MPYWARCNFQVATLASRTMTSPALWDAAVERIALTRVCDGIALAESRLDRRGRVAGPIGRVVYITTAILLNYHENYCVIINDLRSLITHTDIFYYHWAGCIWVAVFWWSCCMMTGNTNSSRTVRSLARTFHPACSRCRWCMLWNCSTSYNETRIHSSADTDSSRSKRSHALSINRFLSVRWF